MSALWLGRRRRPRRAEPAPAPEPPAHPRLPNGVPLLTPAARRAPGARGPRYGPPDPAVAWTAEIDWREADRTARFEVVARSADGAETAVVAQSPEFECPPAPGSVQALTAAADRLEASLMEAGWSRLAPGGAWYARRFGWAPAPVRSAATTARAAMRGPAPLAAAPAARQARAAPSQRQPVRFDRAPGWPEGTGDRWRCEIAWASGYVHSRFRALAYPPGGRKGNPISESRDFKRLLRPKPDPSDAAQRREVQRLAAALKAAGWEPVGRGPRWFAGRYVWRDESTPPDQIPLAPAEAAASHDPAHRGGGDETLDRA